MRLRFGLPETLLLGAKLVQILSDKYISISRRRQKKKQKTQPIIQCMPLIIDRMPSIDASKICFILQPKSAPNLGDEQEGVRY